jgi:hypothetical protein
VAKGLHIHQMDIVMVFLNPNIDGELYMEPSLNIKNFWLWPESTDQIKEIWHYVIYQLLKAFYEHKEAPCLLFKYIDSILKKLGFCPSNNTTNLYTLKDM